MHFRRIRRNPATSRRRRGYAPVPQQPHAATEPTPTPTDLYAGEYRYDEGTLTGLYADGRALLSAAEVNERHANELLGLAARQRVQAADRFRLLKLAELDAVTPAGAQWPQPVPQVPSADALMHFSSPVSGWALCDGDGAAFQSADPGQVTCSACLSELAQIKAQSSPGAEPRAPWTAVPAADLLDTLTLPKVNGAAR